MSLRGLLDLVRPKNAAMSSLGSLIGWLAAGGKVDKLLPAVLVPPLILMGGNAVNDLYDVDVDRINRPGRPIPRGDVSRREAAAAYALLSAAGSAVSLLGGIYPLAVAVTFSLAWLLYAGKLKATGLPGNILVSLGVSATLPYGALCVDGVPPVIWLYSSIAFFSNLARELVKVVEDLPGDSAAGIGTFAVRHGIEATERLIRSLLVGASLAAALPLALGLSGLAYAVGGGASALALLWIAASPGGLTVEGAGRLSSAIKTSMAVGLLSMLLDLALR